MLARSNLILMESLATQLPLMGQAVAAFVCFVLSDVARRPSDRGRRPKIALQGRSVSYGVRVHLRRGSDRAERIYVAVTALQSGGLTNNEACCEVAGRLEPELGRSGRGRPTSKIRSQELANKVETVRSIYNHFKRRHPWKEQLPGRDPVYEQWCTRFRVFQKWVTDIVLSAVSRGLAGDRLAEELMLQRGPGGRNNFEALRALGADGLAACLNSWQPTEPEMTRTKAQRFVAEFFRWERT